MDKNKLIKLMRSAKPIEIKPDRKQMLSSSSNAKRTVRFLPPMNTIIINDLPKKIPRFMAPKDRQDRFKKIPTTFSWRGQPGILEPGNQYKCGSCWTYTFGKKIYTFGLINLKINSRIHKDGEKRIY